MRTYFLIPVCAALAANLGSAQLTQKASIGLGGAEADDTSRAWSISESGRFVLLGSSATNLVPGDTNGCADGFVRDRLSGSTTRVSVDSFGVQGDGNSIALRMSSDDRYVVVLSSATNLVVGDTNGVNDVFVHDRQTGQTTRVSVDSSGVEGDGLCNSAAISSDGRFVAFDSYASNLVVGDTNNTVDVFLHDRQTGQTTRVSVSTAGAQGNKYSNSPYLSADGRYVAFWSLSTNFVSPDANLWDGDAFVHDRLTGVTSVVSVNSNGEQGLGESGPLGISADGRFVLFASDAKNVVAGDTNHSRDIFLHDRVSGQTTRVNVDSAGAEATSGAVTGSMSPDARWIAFESSAANLVSGDTNGKYDVFLHDRVSGQTQRMSLDTAGAQSNDHCDIAQAAVTADGRSVAFSSTATNLVPGDTNGLGDAFVRSLDCPAAVTYCTAKVNSLGCSPTITLSGSASASSGSGALLQTTQALGQKNGVYFHGTQGSAANPFHGGFVCVQAPLKRHALLNSGGTGGTCSGVFQEDLNVYIASGADPALVAGITLHVQSWSRDPADVFGDSLSDAARIDVCQ
ncbi:MAG: hypothetical protein HZA52_10395 [Planctomycetes bacterium]|nr:hypothetical protein [Planctomycetota bacterium]